MIEALIGWSFIVASFATLAFVAWCLFIDDDDPPDDDDPLEHWANVPKLRLSACHRFGDNVSNRYVVSF